jgi:hypothetical protein
MIYRGKAILNYSFCTITFLLNAKCLCNERNNACPVLMV